MNVPFTMEVPFTELLALGAGPVSLRQSSLGGNLMSFTDLFSPPYPLNLIKSSAPGDLTGRTQLVLKTFLQPLALADTMIFNGPEIATINAYVGQVMGDAVTRSKWALLMQLICVVNNGSQRVRVFYNPSGGDRNLSPLVLGNVSLSGNAQEVNFAVDPLVASAMWFNPSIAAGDIQFLLAGYYLRM